MTLTLPLSPVDHIFVGKDSYAIEFLYHFDYPVDATRLRRALQLTVKKFWPVQARIVSDKTGLLWFEKSNEAIDFQELPTAQALPNFESPSDLTRFTAPLKDGVLASFRLARVGDGSVLVATVSHAVVDGYSYFLFMSVLAALYRSTFFSKDYWLYRLMNFDLDRRKLRSQLSSTATPMDPENFYRRTGISIAEERRIPNLKDSKWEFVRFEQQELDQHLNQARRESSLRLSKHDILSALLWKKAAQEWHNSDEDLELSSAFDFRRIHPGLSPLYFGNAVRATVLRLPRSEILQSSLIPLASKIREATDAITIDAVWDALSCLEETRLAHGAEIFQRMHVSHPQRGLLVTNLSRIPAERMNFGQGAPRRVVPLTPAPRSAIVLSDGKDLIARLALP